MTNSGACYFLCARSDFLISAPAPMRSGGCFSARRLSVSRHFGRHARPCAELTSRRRSRPSAAE